MEKNTDIVVVATEARTRAELTSLLGALGYDLKVYDQFPSPEEFVPVAMLSDLIFMEVNLDDFTTAENLVRSASAQRRIPVVYLTDNKEETFFARVKETRPFGFLSKPLDLGSIRRVIELALLYEVSHNGGSNNPYDVEKDDMLGNYSTEQYQDIENFPLYTNGHKNGAEKYFFTKVGNKLKKIALDEVLFVEVEGKYSSIHLHDRRFNVKASLKELIEKFPGDRFVRVSRNFIVNLDVVDYIDTVQYIIRLDERDIPVSRTYKDDLMKRIKLL